jgi:asparagine synthase (glutamine-hydrolysing)
MMHRIRGEFAFAVWDEAHQTLFAARDLIGTRPFYYADTSGSLIFSNSLDCIRLHPDVRDDLDELAVADFLLFGCNQNHSSTVYRDIQRLPAGHFALFRDGGSRVESYWSFPEDEPLALGSDEDYVEECRRLLRESVRERMPRGRLALLMSGGLDSTALAAIACHEGQIPPRSIHAFTSALRSKNSDGEARYAELAASALGVTHHIHWDDHELVDPSWWTNPVATPEPSDAPLALRFEQKRYAEMARWAHVVLFGEGPDNALLFEPGPHLRWLLSDRGLPQALLTLIRHAGLHRRAPRAGLPGRLLSWAATGAPHPRPYPAWIQPELTKRLALRDRWHLVSHPTPPAHRWRPRAAASFASPLWEDMLTKLDPAWTGAPLEFRHPYLDERVLRFFLQLPAMPWCREKLILRRALDGLLPEELLRRKKSPLHGEPEHEILKCAGFPPLRSGNGLERFADLKYVPISPSPSPEQFWADLRVYSLDLWLSGHRPIRNTSATEFNRKEAHGEAGGAVSAREEEIALCPAEVDDIRDRH